MFQVLRGRDICRKGHQVDAKLREDEVQADQHRQAAELRHLRRKFGPRSCEDPRLTSASLALIKDLISTKKIKIVESHDETPEEPNYVFGNFGEISNRNSCAGEVKVEAS